MNGKMRLKIPILIFFIAIVIVTITMKSYEIELWAMWLLLIAGDLFGRSYDRVREELMLKRFNKSLELFTKENLKTDQCDGCTDKCE
jgi:hypothetical protein